MLGPPQLRVHLPPEAQGDVWQRSIRPQQEVPWALARSLTTLKVDICLSRRWLPQLGQSNGRLSEALDNKNSETWPHS